MLASLQKFKLFSSLDLRSGYCHIGLAPEAKLKTAFTTTSRKWQWNVVPFGIYSLPSMFCYLMSQVLSSLDFCFRYLDDILIYSTLWEEHLKHLETVFNGLKSRKLKIKLSKCQFCKHHLLYLGHFISKQGIQALLEKINAVANLKEPNNVNELHHFLGLTD